MDDRHEWWERKRERGERERERERDVLGGSGKSVPATRHDNDDDELYKRNLNVIFLENYFNFFIMLCLPGFRSFFIY